MVQGGSTLSCTDPEIGTRCPLYQYRAGVYRARCQDGSGLAVGSGRLTALAPAVEHPTRRMPKGARWRVVVRSKRLPYDELASVPRPRTGGQACNEHSIESIFGVAGGRDASSGSSMHR
jgi:hypothetical protein